MGAPVLLEEIGWPDVEAYLGRDDRLILVTGSCEQHGRHLSFSTDTLIPLEIAHRVSARTQVPVAPPLGFGMSLHHLEFPGTLSLQPSTFSAVLSDLLQSAEGHGFQRILVLNGHGGNKGPIDEALASLLEGRELRVKVGHWWQHPAVDAVIREAFGGPEFHASAAETSCIMAIRPQIPRMDRAAFSAPAGGIEYHASRHWRAFYPYGAVGLDPALASAAAGDRILETAAASFARELEDWQTLEPADAR